MRLQNNIYEQKVAHSKGQDKLDDSLDMDTEKKTQVND
jgi:hypothetical protein